MEEKLILRLIDSFLLADRDQANAIIDEYSQVYGFESAVTNLMDPALERVGEMWRGNYGISLAQAYVSGKVAEDLLTKLAVERTENHPEGQVKRSIVIGNIVDDFHSLGRRLVVTFLKLSGWEVYDLGNDVTPEEFLEKSIEVGAYVVGASAMMYTTAINIKKLRDEIDKRGLKDKLMLAVGGAVFKLRPELVEEVGGDGTAKTALEVPVLMEKLWHQAEKNRCIHE